MLKFTPTVIKFTTAPKLGASTSWRLTPAFQHGGATEDGNYLLQYMDGRNGDEDRFCDQREVEGLKEAIEFCLGNKCVEYHEFSWMLDEDHEIGIVYRIESEDREGYTSWVITVTDNHNETDRGPRFDTVTQCVEWMINTEVK